MIIEKFKKQEIMPIRDGKKLFNNAFPHPFIVDKDSANALSLVKGKLKTTWRQSLT